MGRVSECLQPGRAHDSGGAIDADLIRRILPGPAGASLFTPEFVRGRDLAAMRDELERVYLTMLGRDTGGDVDAMVKALRVKRATLYRWLKRLGIDIRSLRARRERR